MLRIKKEIFAHLSYVDARIDQLLFWKYSILSSALKDLIPQNILLKIVVCK